MTSPFFFNIFEIFKYAAASNLLISVPYFCPFFLLETDCLAAVEFVRSEASAARANLVNEDRDEPDNAQHH